MRSALPASTRFTSASRGRRIKHRLRRSSSVEHPIGVVHRAAVNSSVKHASHPLKLLFVCSRNRWRSPTAEKLFHGVDGLQARSAGSEDGARVKVTAGHLGWADLIFVMEPRHARRLRAKFAEELAGKPVICLHIPDDFQFMQPELIALLESAVTPHLAADA